MKYLSTVALALLVTGCAEDIVTTVVEYETDTLEVEVHDTTYIDIHDTSFVTDSMYFPTFNFEVQMSSSVGQYIGLFTRDRNGDLVALAGFRTIDGYAGFFDIPTVSGPLYVARSYGFIQAIYYVEPLENVVEGSIVEEFQLDLREDILLPYHSTTEFVNMVIDRDPWK